MENKTALEWFFDQIHDEQNKHRFTSEDWLRTYEKAGELDLVQKRAIVFETLKTCGQEHSESLIDYADTVIANALNPKE